MNLIPVGNYNDAADKTLINLAHEFIVQQQQQPGGDESSGLTPRGGGGGVIMLVSNDLGFAPLLRYAESKGICCIHLAPPHRYETPPHT